MTLTDFQHWALPKMTGRKDFAQEREYKEERKESRIQLLVLNGNFAMMGLLQKCLMVPVMHFAPSGKRRKRNSSD